MPWDRTQDDWLAELQNLATVAQSTVAPVPATAAGTDYEVPIFSAGLDSAYVRVARVSVVPSAAVAAVATNYATLTVRRYTSAGTLVGALAGTWTSNSTGGNAIAQFARQLITAPALNLNPGDVLTLQATHGGTGEALPALAAIIEHSPITQGPPAVS